MKRSYDVTVRFEGEAEITVEADNPEEAVRMARDEFSTFDINDVSVIHAFVEDEEEEG